MARVHIERLENPLKRWKFSGMDIEARLRWADYSEARNEMFKHTHSKKSPWYVIDSDSQKRARLNCISHLLSVIPYEEIKDEEGIKLPKHQKEKKAYPIPGKLKVKETYFKK